MRVIYNSEFIYIKVYASYYTKQNQQNILISNDENWV